MGWSRFYLLQPNRSNNGDMKMNKNEVYEKLEKWVTIYKENGCNVSYNFCSTALKMEIQEIEQKLKLNLPRELKDFFLNISKKIYLNVDFENEVQWNNSGKVSSAYIFISLKEIYDAECSRRKWVEDVFFDIEDSYSRKWHHKLGITSLINGDIIAMDLEKKEHPIIYLSHDDGDGHGYILGRTFNKYVEAVIELGGCGTEEDEFLQFCKDGISGIDFQCINAIQLRKKLENFEKG